MQEKNSNYNIRLSWLEDQTSLVAKEINTDDDNAFLYLSASLLLEIPPSEIDTADVVDGGQDKQIDLIHIEDDPEKGFAEITIMQTKNTTGFGSNDIILLKNGLEWIFERPKAEIQNLPNLAFKNKIEEIRALRTNYGLGKLSISVFYITKGDKQTQISDEFAEEAKGIIDKYSAVEFEDFRFETLGAHELIEILSLSEQSKRKVDINIPIVYDTNIASAIRYSQGDTKSFLCTILGETLAEIASSDPRDAIFDLNVRPYYGARGKVNKDIYNTCSGDDAEKFWFLNNGVTMVCDRFDFNQDTDNPQIKVLNAQIVNGCQTSVTIREAYEKGELSKDVRVLLKLYSTDNPNLIDKITLTTNNQNKITDRDLRANDPVQRDIENRLLEKYEHFYERKNKQHRHLTGDNKKKIVPSPKAAQAYLAVVRKKPGNARGYLGAIWSDFYNEIFSNSTVDDLLLAYKLYKFCQSKSVETKKLNIHDIHESETRIYGMFHIARVLGHRLTNDSWGNSNISEIETMLKNEDLNAVFEQHYNEALTLVKQQRVDHYDEHPITAMYFKTRKSQETLNKLLYTENKG